MTAITFTLPFIPKSLKNYKGVRRGQFYKPKVICQEQIAMRAAVLDAMNGAAIRRPRDKAFFGDDDIAIEMVVNARAKETVVTIRSVGPKPKGFTGRNFDLGNVSASLHDALQGIVFDDDRQIVSNTETKVLPTPTKGTT